MAVAVAIRTEEKIDIFDFLPHRRYTTATVAAAAASSTASIYEVCDVNFARPVLQRMRSGVKQRRGGGGYGRHLVCFLLDENGAVLVNITCSYLQCWFYFDFVITINHSNMPCSRDMFFRTRWIIGVAFL